MPHLKTIIGLGALLMCGASTQMAYASDVDDPWLIRVRALAVVPEETATVETIQGFVEIGDQFVPELDITYFFSENLSAELILAVTPHSVDVEQSALGDVDLGKTWLLPPTLNVQYHFAPRARFRPYIGAGVNYTTFFGGNSGDVVDVDYSDSFGFSLQAGIDLPMNDVYFLNLDLKKVFIQTDVTVDAGAAGVVGADVNIDPWVIGVGVGRRF